MFVLLVHTQEPLQHSLLLEFKDTLQCGAQLIVQIKVIQVVVDTVDAFFEQEVIYSAPTLCGKVLRRLILLERIEVAELLDAMQRGVVWVLATRSRPRIIIIIIFNGFRHDSCGSSSLGKLTPLILSVHALSYERFIGASVKHLLLDVLHGILEKDSLDGQEADAADPELLVVRIHVNIGVFFWHDEAERVSSRWRRLPHIRQVAAQ